VARNDGKTEKPTPRRRKEARDEGQVARSAEIPVMVSLLGGVLVARIALPGAIDTFATETRGLFQDLALTSEVAVSMGRMMLAVVAPFAGVAVVGALAGGFAQVGFKVSPKAARPKLKNLSPKKGLERFKPTTALWELVRTAAKLGLLVAVVWGPLGDLGEDLRSVRALGDGIGVVAGAMWTLMIRGVLIAMVIGAADYAVNRRKLENQLKMTREELRREHKDAEGDPYFKAHRRRKAAELSRNRMLRDVATADVVLVNPTELAVALSYEPGAAAPRVVARGADHMAARIRREAGRHGVPILADKPLCRAIHRRCKVGDLIPPVLYEAVAVVLAWAYRRSGRAPGRAA
jgi:flagellar biosynthesis protein FlhB